MLVKICFSNGEKVVFLEAKELTIDKVKRSILIYTGSRIHGYWLNKVDFLDIDGFIAVKNGKSTY